MSYWKISSVSLYRSLYIYIYRDGSAAHPLGNVRLNATNGCSLPRKGRLVVSNLRTDAVTNISPLKVYSCRVVPTDVIEVLIRSPFPHINHNSTTAGLKMICDWQRTHPPILLHLLPPRCEEIRRCQAWAALSRGCDDVDLSRISTTTLPLFSDQLLLRLAARA